MAITNEIPAEPRPVSYQSAYLTELVNRLDAAHAMANTQLNMAAMVLADVRDSIAKLREMAV
jgi:hypothetical protein